jgi:hypothetical protein
MSEHIFLPSVNEGKLWQLSAFPGRAVAYEGVSEGGFFSMEIHVGAGRHPATHVEIARPSTHKRKVAALLQLEQQMKAAGLIAGEV